MTALDRWGQLLAADLPDTVDAWNDAWDQFLHFRGDPMATLADANRDDDAFVLGPVLCATYRVLGGAPPDSSALVTEVGLAHGRAAGADERSRAHVHALDALVAGNFAEAADRWDALARSASDFAALRFAHDVQLHCGHAVARLESTSAALTAWPADRVGHGFVLGMHAFALEELGRYDEAVGYGRAALAADPDDAWALHALAHVYESTDDHDAAVALLGGHDSPWHRQDLLATHIWWHLAIRLLAAGDHDGVLAIFDRLLPTASTAFRLCDLTSLLWRLELAGSSVGDRWAPLADAWAGVAERHTCGFLDMHAAMAFARCSDHPGAAVFLAGLDASHRQGSSENDLTFRSVVVPLVDALGAYARGDLAAAAQGLDAVRADAHRIGGSVAQRDIIAMTLAAAAAGTAAAGADGGPDPTSHPLTPSNDGAPHP